MGTYRRLTDVSLVPGRRSLSRVSSECILREEGWALMGPLVEEG